MALFFFLISQLTGLLPDPKAVIEKTCANRDEIRSGEFQLNIVRDFYYNPKGENQSSQEITIINFWLNGKKLRTDEEYIKYHDWQTDTSMNKWINVNYFEGNGSISHGIFKNKQATIAIKPNDPQTSIQMYNPKCIGIYPSYFLYTKGYHPRSLIDHNNGKDFNIAIDNKSCDVETFKVEFKNEFNVKFDFWIAKDQGYSVRKARVHSKSNQLLYDTDIDVQQDASSQLWFPSKVIVRYFENNKPIFTETMAVTVRRLNQSIPDIAFRIAGLGLAPNTPVQNLDKNRELIWDGQKLVAATRENSIPSNLEIAPEIPAKSNRWIYLTVACVLILIFAQLQIIKLRRRTTDA